MEQCYVMEPQLRHDLKLIVSNIIIPLILKNYKHMMDFLSPVEPNDFILKH